MYSRFVAVCLRRRYLTMATALAILIASAGMVAGGRLVFTFLTSADSEFVVANVRMPVGSPIEATDRAVRKIERTALAMPEVDSVFSLVGASQNLEGGDRSSQAHLGQLYLELHPVQQRDRSSSELVDAMRRQLGDMPEVDRLRFEEAQGGPGGPDISLAVLGESPEQIMPVVEAIQERLDDFQGVYEVADDADAGQRELRIELREGATELGFTVEHLAEQIRGAVYGLEAYTFPGQREDVDVRVMLDERSRRSLARLESMYVFTPEGRPVPLGEVALLTEAEGYATIQRLDGQQAVTVTADVDEQLNNIEKVMAAVGPELQRLAREHPGVQIIPQGRQEDMADSFRSLPIGMFAAVAMIYVILAWLFSSYLQPFAVLLAVPFAGVGAIWGHLIMGFDMTILSLIGFVALTGIVVNDSLIFMEFYNHRREEHDTALEALRSAGEARFRAIMLTTLTTVLGLSPLMLEQSFQARFLIPMAITISFGLIAATGVTLIVLPCLLLIGQDVRPAARLIWTGSAAAPEPEPTG